MSNEIVPIFFFKRKTLGTFRGPRKMLTLDSRTLTNLTRRFIKFSFSNIPRHQSLHNRWLRFMYFSWSCCRSFDAFLSEWSITLPFPANLTSPNPRRWFAGFPESIKLTFPRETSYAVLMFLAVDQTSFLLKFRSYQNKRIMLNWSCSCRKRKACVLFG